MGSWRAAVAVDHNGDGIVDPLLVHASDDPLLYLSDGCTAAGWLEVEAPHGSRVEVTAGGVTQTAWITTDSACGGARLPRAHFGLGDAAQVDALTITLPGGDTIAAEAPFEARRIVTLSDCLLYTSPSPRDLSTSRMPSSA